MRPTSTHFVRRVRASAVECSQSHFALLVFLDIPGMRPTTIYFINRVRASKKTFYRFTIECLMLNISYSDFNSSLHVGQIFLPLKGFTSFACPQNIQAGAYFLRII